MLEIERKYLVAHLPEGLEDATHHPIRQGYLAVTSDGTSVRVRQMGDQFYLTVKRGSGLARLEIEIQLAPDQFDALWAGTEPHRLEKVRYHLPVGPHLAEVDVFGGTLTGLVLVEVEFATVEEAHRFMPPPWFGVEVTDDPRYENRRLAGSSAPPGRP